MRSLLLPTLAWTSGPAGVRTVVFVVAAALLAGLSAALLPALDARRTDFRAALGRARTTLGRARVRKALLVAQVALSVLLLIGAGLFVRSLREAADIDLGFDPEGVLLVSFQTERGVSPETRRSNLDRAVEILRTRPEVESLTVPGIPPLSGSWAVELRVPGLDERPRLESGGPYVYPVSPGFFETMRLDIVRGRPIDARDREGAPRVAVVNETMAARYWPGEDALGRCLIIGDPDGPCTEVVGVAEDAHRQALLEGDQFLYYVPLEQKVVDTGVPGVVFARTRVDPASVATDLYRQISAAVTGVRNVRVMPFTDVVAPQLRSWRLGATVFGAFGVLALLVAAAGLYSSLSFEVARRSREIGVRSALGATARAIVRFIVGQGLRPVAVGVLGGLFLAWALQPLIEERLYGVSATDLTTYLAVTMAMLAVALASVSLPARRAARIDAVRNLQAD